jgi:uncharacterized protein YodC (DUF2158 family)
MVEFKVGDVVSLKSGGPPVTVEEEKNCDDYIHVVWFSGSVLHRDVILESNLVKVSGLA